MPRVMSMKGSRSLIVGVAVVLVAGLSVYVAVIAPGGLPFASYKYVRAAFDDVGSLQVGDDVRQNSVRVGRVQHIEYDGTDAVATLQLDGNQPVYRDARATIGARSGLGEKFVQLTPGTQHAGPLDDGMIPASRTANARDLDWLLDAFDRSTRNALSQALKESGGGLAEHGSDLHVFLDAAPNLLEDLGTVAQAAASDDANFPALLRSAHTLAGRFTDREEKLTALVRNVERTTRAVAVDDTGPMRRTLHELPDTLRDAQTALDALDKPLADTESALRTLRPGLAALGASTPNLRGLLREGVDPMRAVPGVAAAADPAVVDLTRTISDARPLARSAAKGLASARTPLEVIAPYSSEVSNWFTYITSALSNRDKAGHWLRIMLVPGSESVTGTLPVKDPLVQRDPYPAPGQAENDRANTVGGPR